MDESLCLCIVQLVLELMVQFEVVYSDGSLWLEHTCSRPAKHTWDFSTNWTQFGPYNKIFVCVCE